MENLKKKNFFIGFLFLSLFLAFIPAGRAIDVDTEKFYITSGDVIRNFKFQSFDGKTITSGGTVVGLDDRLKFEMGATWTANPYDVHALYAEQVGDIVYINYDVLFTREFNFYSNVDLNGAVETGKSADPIRESFQTGLYKHFGLFGPPPHIVTTSYISFTHLDVGNIYAHNRDYNTFSGNLEMNFDIDPTPLPDTLVDSNGNTANKQFDYIGIKTVYVVDSTHGFLSETAPYVVGLEPSEYDSKADALVTDAKPDGFYAAYDPNVVLSNPPVISNTYDVRTQSATIGSYLNPTLKNGGDLYDPKESEKSTENCTFTYNIGALSPLVIAYSNTLSYNYQECSTQDGLFGLTYSGLYSKRESATRVTALHVSNRYIHATIGVMFSVWSSYKIEAIESDLPGLQFPQEYYDLLIFNSMVDGFGGGELYHETPNFLEDILGVFGQITNIIITLIILAIVGVVLYVVAKFIIGKSSRSRNAQSNVVISTK